MVATALGMGGLFLHRRVDPDDATPLWLVDDQDQEAIARPLARILARHTPVMPGEEATDVLDGIMAGVGVVGYVVKNRTQEVRYRRAVEGAPGNGIPPT